MLSCLEFAQVIAQANGPLVSLRNVLVAILEAEIKRIATGWMTPGETITDMRGPTVAARRPGGLQADGDDGIWLVAIAKRIDSTYVAFFAGLLFLLAIEVAEPIDRSGRLTPPGSPENSSGTSGVKWLMYPVLLRKLTGGSLELMKSVCYRGVPEHQLVGLDGLPLFLRLGRRELRWSLGGDSRSKNENNDNRR